MGEKEGWRNEIKKNRNIRKNGGTNRNWFDVKNESLLLLECNGMQWNLQEQIDSWTWYIALSQTLSWKSFESDFIGAWLLPKFIISIEYLYWKNMLNVTNSLKYATITGYLNFNVIFKLLSYNNSSH